jgi:hypothetical protein
MTLALSIIAKARIINYDSKIVIYSFIVLATVNMIINYDCTVITIVNYDRKTFIVQATSHVIDDVTRAQPLSASFKSHFFVIIDTDKKE